MKEYEIIDNFLLQEEYILLHKNTLENDYFPLYLKCGVAQHTLSKDGIYFTHNFFSDESIKSPFFEILYPILKKINPIKILRVQLNLYPKTFFIKKHEYHKDCDISHKGMIYYLNTNNGKTILHDGTKIKSVKNRALFFDPSKIHRSTTCTNSSYRSNIIFNYL
jgi:hypothetical protein